MSMIYNFAFRNKMMPDGRGSNIEIETSEEERRFIKHRIRSISCTRHDGHRIIRLDLDPECIFSREDEQLLSQMIRRIDGIVESYVFDMHDEPRGLCIHFRRRYFSTDNNQIPAKTEFHGYDYSWSITGSDHSPRKTEISWPYLQHSLKDITVSISHGGSPRYSSPEKWEIAGEPEGISLSAEGLEQRDEEAASQTSDITMPARVVINGRYFSGATGLRLLKLRHDTCPFPEWQEAWDNVEPLRFKDIARSLKDMDRRRMAIASLGIDRLIADIDSTLVKEETIAKVTNWVDTDGNIRTYQFSDTYSIHRVKWATLFGDMENPREGMIVPFEQRSHNFYFVKFKDTSTQRDHIIWVDLREVHWTNHPEISRDEIRTMSQFRMEKMSSPIDAIAWTFMTRLSKGSIEAIIRQGDCILARPVKDPVEESPRHLTGEEYRTRLRAES